MVDTKELFEIRDGESSEDYELRIESYHDAYNMTWEDVKEIINEHLDLNHTEGRYRKQYALYLRGRKDAVETKEEENNLAEKMIELKKERVKFSDEKNQANAYIRRLSREETIKDIAASAAEVIASAKPFLPVKPIVRLSEKSAILCISDWHYGITCNNAWNKYDTEIAKERIANLLEETIRICDENEITRLSVVNLGDLIAGRIHLQIRLESRIDVITQIMEISEILAEFLNELSQRYEVDYYDCIDNHSRIEPNKHDSMDLESLARITHWYLKTRMDDAVVIHENEYGDDIITFEQDGYKICAVHGDADNLNSIVDHLSLMTKQHYDMILAAHFHHFSGDEKNETVVVGNGSLMGTDSFAKKLRLSSKPSQNLIILSDKSVCESIHRILV